MNTAGNSPGSSALNIEDILGSKISKVSVIVMILCFCILLMDGYDYGIISNASPLIMKEWNIEAAMFGPVFSVATFGWMIGAVVFGAISDRIGRKGTLLIGAAIFTVLSLCLYFSRTLSQLVIIRLITGFGVGGAVPVAMTMTSEYAPQNSKAKFVSIMFSGFMVGSTLGSYIAAGMMPAYGWRSIFLLGFIIPIPVIVCLAIFLPESARWLSLNLNTPQRRETLIRIVKRISPDLQIDDTTQFVAIKTEKKKEKYSPKELFAGKLAWVSPMLWLYYIISSLAVFFIGNWMPQVLVLKGLTAAHASSLMGTSGLFGILGTALIGVWLDKMGFRWGFIWPLLAILFTALTGGATGGILLVWMCINSFFMNGEHTSITSIVPNMYPVRIRAKGSGISNALAKIGSIIGPVIGGILISTGISMSKLFYFVSIPFIFCAVFSYVLGVQYDRHFSKLYSSGEQTPSEAPHS
ncbi:MFS transporter, AAHS family, 4-hydroxybenzoate transporter [Sporobacter termitidis DSM 10068]|uniref:MFS transporter, AAHS family, 4-hydroxybenzoate transporter n=1 Tax=Sporobacter termitidis DSM 10068 TaxID=1123282 RepID=A0A1M5XT70_9FIRM|nr:MFS transporter [Sporobacter termitidis]SHI02997.1 MFS transporter, AAHS family, 4-hydroxybenzoate transporter [Sporobacter termitidis DSM 10068]